METEFAPEMPDIQQVKPKLVDKYFRMTPDWFYDNAMYNILSPTARRVYDVLQRYVCVRDYVGKLANKTLSAEAEVSRDHICDYIKELTELGLVSNLKTGWVRYYKLNLNKPAFLTQEHIDRVRARKQKATQRKKGTAKSTPAFSILPLKANQRTGTKML